ncbi:uncharacterized protein MONBRDRAFT_37484 [Monosiga brevicollis MX1]|uniref:Signal peptidase complex subunit 3 n=1 Tax=Monosiga brevicollis TaxID=81824 RepID=A9V213_MONBE|nr:uncharacterized protein MONBRDRAFT_37484 [Monosiga brevicollis MX1]EDQ88534.1 predicted protein [Monosiga brevicollis MX1]|eukprot:XP_001746638.1 hypothetical protein [Monosiga brevicollis MX1]
MTMHNFVTRANALFAYAFSCLAIATLGCFLTASLESAVPSVDIRVNNPVVGDLRQFHHIQKSYDRASFTFDIDADLSPLFNWNTKQLFLYMTAEYKTRKNRLNQVVVWDQIVLRNSGADRFNLSNVQLKYPFFDDGHGLLKNKDVTLALHWNVIPVAGLLPRVADGHVKVEFGDYYQPWQ